MQQVQTLKTEIISVLDILPLESIQILCDIANFLRVQNSPSHKDKAIADMKTIAQLVAKAWTSPKSGVELIEEQRRF